MDWTTCFQGKKILVVEDDSINRELMKDILSQMQCQIDFALDGNEAVTKTSSAPYDLIFMDLRMPNKDGVQATKEIRASQSPNKSVPILALTASTSDSADALKQIGMSEVVYKPLNLEQLRQKMALFLTR